MRAARKIARSVHEAARDKARAIAKTEAYAVSRRERKKVEMLFAHLKRILRLGRLRLRGPNGANDEFLLAATAQNLRKLAKLITLPAPIFATGGEGLKPQALMVVATAIRSRRPSGFFNTIDVKQSSGLLPWRRAVGDLPRRRLTGGRVLARLSGGGTALLPGRVCRRETSFIVASCENG